MIGGKFKDGDKVVLLEDYGSYLKGDTGVVVATRQGVSGERLVNVRMAFAGICITCFEQRLDKVTNVSSPAHVLTPSPEMHLSNTIGRVVATSDKIFPRRSCDTILKSLMEEMGELATEIAIAQGTKKRPASADGVKGEAVDVFIVAIDMLRQTWGDELFTSAFTDKVASKLEKWERVK